MKISAQEKIAELERRIIALEALVGTKEQWASAAHTANVQRQTVTRTTTSTAPLSTEQEGALDRMWGHFGKVFEEFGKAFK